MAGPDRRAEVLVGGGGPAGATLARLLAAAGRSVLLVQSGRGGPDRVELLPPGTRPLLDALGLLDRVARPGVARPCLGILRSWDGPAERDDFLLRAGGEGLAVDRAVLDGLLLDLAEAAGATVLRGARVVSAARDAAGGVLTRVRDERSGAAFTVASRIAVDATGRPAGLARRLGARRRHGSRLFAARGPAEERCPGDGPTWLTVRALPDGWCYGLGGPRAHDVWFLSDSPGAAMRQAAPRTDAGGAAVMPAVVEAGMALLDPIVTEGCVAVGDAAAAYDPVASQGLWGALAGSLHLADAIRAGTPAALARYAALTASGWDATRRGRAGIYAGAARFARRPFWRGQQSSGADGSPPPS